MATVNLSINTEDKTAEISVDGTVLENVTYVWLSLPREDDEYSSFHLEVNQFNTEENGLKKFTRLMANKSEDLSKLAEAGYTAKSELKDFTEILISKDQEQIARMF